MNLAGVAASKLKQRLLVFLRPSAVIIDVSPDIRRIAVDDVFLRGFGNHLIERFDHEPPIRLNETRNVVDLVDDLRDVRPRESTPVSGKMGCSTGRDD